MSIKRVIILFVTVLVTGLFAGTSANASVEAYTAELVYASANWKTQEWGTKVHTTISGAGKYSLSFDGAGNGVAVLSINLPGASDYWQKSGLRLADLQIYADGKQIPVELSKVLCKESEIQGNYSIEIYHVHGVTSQFPPIDPTKISFDKNLTVKFTLSNDHPADDLLSKPTIPTSTDDIDGSDPADLSNPSEEGNPFGKNDPVSWLVPVSIGIGITLAAAAVLFAIVKQKRS